MAVWIRVVLGLAGLKVVLGLAAGVIDPIAATDAGAVFGSWIYQAVSLAFASVGVLLVWRGALDSRAIHLGAVFILVATMFAERFLTPFASGTGIVAGFFRFLSFADPVAFRPYFVWRFAVAFPRQVSFGWPRRVASLMLRLTLAGGAFFFAGSVLAAIATLPGVTLDHAWIAAIDRRGDAPFYWLFLTPLTLGAIVLIAVNTRSASALERRRARVFVVGLLVGTGPILVEVLLELLVPPFGAYMSQPAVRAAAGLIVYPLLISIPISTGYAVVVDQVLSVRLVVRTAIRYALARATIVGLCAVPFVLLLWLAWTAREGGAASLAGEGRVFALGALVLGGLLLLRARQSLLVAVDRQFFREQYDSRAILGALVHQSRGAHTLTELAGHLTREIDRALHVEGIAVMVADASSGRLVAVGSAVEPLPGDASLVTLLAGASEPLDVNLEQPRSMLARLPSAERQWLADGGFQLLVPMLGGAGTLAGVIAIRHKRSELPFSREDRWLLAAIASSSTLAIENLQLRTPDELLLSPALRGHALVALGAGDAPARECVSCGVVQPPQTVRCPTCEKELRDSPVPLVVRGMYRIERLLGRGGMGVVYRASDLSLGRTVAIKTLPSVSPERALRLRREAKAMAAVAHPKLATIYAIELWRGTPLLIVECFAQTLHDRLRTGPLRATDAVRIGVELAEGLEALHTAGILHRDVKPSNIGFTARGTPKLLDFGLAKVIRHTRAVDTMDASQSTISAAPEDPADSVSAPLQMIGTPLYISPEAVHLKPPDAGVDLWALALVLYESIAGVHPMRAATPLEMMTRIAKAQVPDVREHRPDCPPALALFLQQALHADSRRRPGTARAFRLDLEATLQPALAN
jgi:hypothetical protein